MPDDVTVQREIAELMDRAEHLASTAHSHLSAATQAINRFRQVVLAAACSGRLTADWRDANPNAGSVSVAELPRKRTRAVAIDEPLDLELPDLPDTYAVTTVGDVAALLDYGTSKRSGSEADGIPVLRMGNIQDGRLDLSEIKYCKVDREIGRLILQDGDLLFNRTNSPELVGKAAVFHENETMTFASYLIRVRFLAGVVDPDFANYWINSAWGRTWARHVKTDGVSQSNINGTKLGAMPLPLPPLAEQHEAVLRASQLLSTADVLLARLKSADRSLRRSSQAVLTKAFRGELVGAHE